MSGIFKGDSIYNNGGGGSGYKDGGELIDGDFIKVENNTISSYDNVSRDPINFYFEYEDGDILNAVINLNTAVNSTIKIYVLKNGFYYPLSVNGSDTVSAGNEYQINIDIATYSICQIHQNNIAPSYALINGLVIPCYLSYAQTRLFTAQIGGSGNSYGPYYYNGTQARKFKNNAGNGWKLIHTNGQEYQDFVHSSIPLMNLGYYDKNYGPQLTNNAVILSDNGYGMCFNGNSNTPTQTTSLGSDNLYPTFVLFKNL